MDKVDLQARQAPVDSDCRFWPPGSRPSIASLRSRTCICASVCVCICAYICVFICAFICICIRVCICAGIPTLNYFLEVSLGGHGCSGDDHFGSCSDGDNGLDIGGDDDNGGRGKVGGKLRIL